MTTPISAGSLAGIDLERIRSKSIGDAEDLVRLGQLIDSGNDSDDDFLRMCRLLIEYGERDKAMELLLANCEPEDAAYSLFQREFPECQFEFDRAVKAFENQFACDLNLRRKVRHLSSTYECSASKTRKTSCEFFSEFFSEFLHEVAEPEVQITYDPTGTIVGDLFEVRSTNAVPLLFSGGKWVKSK